jgi:hypothetical protein
LRRTRAASTSLYPTAARCERSGDIDVDDVPGLGHHRGSRDPVTDHLVPAGADRGREPLVAKLAGRAAATRVVFTHPAIDVRRGDAGREARADVRERLRRDAPGVSKQGTLGRTEDLDGHGREDAEPGPAASNSPSPTRGTSGAPRSDSISRSRRSAGRSAAWKRSSGHRSSSARRGACGSCRKGSGSWRTPGGCSRRWRRRWLLSPCGRRTRDRERQLPKARSPALAVSLGRAATNRALRGAFFT